MKELLIKLKACDPAIEWAGDKTWEEIYNTCHRGDWLLWLHNRTNKEDLQVRTLAKGHCANTVRHLMKYDTSLKAVDTAIAYGEGRATRAELDSAAEAADAAYADAAAASAEAAFTAARATYAAATYAKAAYAADDAFAAARAAVDASHVTTDYARFKNQKETADIVRKYIPIELWNIQKMIDELKLEKEVSNEK